MECHGTGIKQAFRTFAARRLSQPFLYPITEELPVAWVPSNFGSIFPSFAGFSVFDPKFAENFGSSATSNSQRSF
jgi:hypothetical protein